MHNNLVRSNKKPASQDIKIKHLKKIKVTQALFLSQDNISKQYLLLIKIEMEQIVFNQISKHSQV